jgi:hypothetical protein
MGAGVPVVRAISKIILVKTHNLQTSSTTQQQKKRLERIQ